MTVPKVKPPKVATKAVESDASKVKTPNKYEALTSKKRKLTENNSSLKKILIYLFSVDLLKLNYLKLKRMRR